MSKPERGTCDECLKGDRYVGPFKADDGRTWENLCGPCRLRVFFSNPARVKGIEDDMRRALLAVTPSVGPVQSMHPINAEFVRCLKEQLAILRQIGASQVTIRIAERAIANAEAELAASVR